MESKHTKGAAKIHPESDNHIQQFPIEGGDGRALCFIPARHPNAEANAEFIAEAFNVANETGKTPRELQEENKKLRSLPMYDVEELNEILTLYNNGELSLYDFVGRVWNKAYFVGANEGMKVGLFNTLEKWTQ